MEVNVLKSSEEEMEVELENVTLAEILRVYLNGDSGVTLAAWKREHPTKRPVLKIATKGKSPKEAVRDAVSSLTDELDKALSDFKELK